MVFIPLVVPAQTKEELQKQIKNTTDLLNTTQKTQAEVLDSYYVLQHQLNQRAKIIKAIQKEIQTTNYQMEASALSVDSIELEIERLKTEFGMIMRQAYRQKKSKNDWLFLFSANSFNQALKRWRYLQQYKEYRKQQVQLILEKRTVFNQKIQQLTENKDKQEILLLEEVNQRKMVQEEIDMKGNILGQLKQEASAINRLLQAQKTAHQRLASSVESAILKDITIKKENNIEQAIDTKKSSAPSRKLSPSITYDFLKRKGQFAWPIKQGVIVRYFGNQPHPIHKKIVINNNGIDIKARSNPTVFSLFEGIVKAIQIVPGYKNTLILQHGDFYTVYSNLESIKVKKGDIILAQQAIGIAAIPTQKVEAELHFELWKGKQRLNPYSWLRKL